MYIMYISDEKRTVRFPVTPGKINMKVNNKNKTVTLINEGEVNIIKSPGLTDITMDELILPMITRYPFAVYENGFHPADYYLNLMEQWKFARKPVTFAITRLAPHGKRLSFETNMDVTIEDYEIVEDAGAQGFDIKIKLKMKQYRYWGSKKLVLKKDAKSGKATKLKAEPIRKTKTPAKTYIVKKGDCLYNIAKKELNDASKWKKIYELNKKTIEDAAKKHGRKSSSNGHWIWAGTKLKLPR